MKTPLQITPYGQSPISGVFTDEHSASSYGIPVFVADDGRILGPSDIDAPYGNNLYLPTQQSEPVDHYENTVPIGKSGSAVMLINIEPEPAVVTWLQEYIVNTWALPFRAKWGIPQMQRGQELLRRCAQIQGSPIALNRIQ